MSARLPTKAEWEEAGFKVPDELCHDERDLKPSEVMRELASGKSDPISDLALAIVDDLELAVTQREIAWCDIELMDIAETCIREFMMQIVNKTLSQKCPVCSGVGQINVRPECLEDDYDKGTEPCPKCSKPYQETNEDKNQKANPA